MTHFNHDPEQLPEEELNTAPETVEETGNEEVTDAAEDPETPEAEEEAGEEEEADEEEAEAEDAA